MAAFVGMVIVEYSEVNVQRLLNYNKLALAYEASLCRLSASM